MNINKSSNKLIKHGTYVTEKIHTNCLSLQDYVTTENLLQNKQGLTCVDALPAKDANVTAFKKGDILIANIRPYLKKIWFATHDGGCSSDVLTIRANKSTDSKFLYYTLLRDDFFIHVMNGSKGTKMPRGEKSQIMEFLIPAFDLDLQKKVAATLSVLDDKIKLNNQINAELEAMAKTLYDYWFVQFDFPNADGKPYKSTGGKVVYNEVLKREIPEGWKDSALWNIAIYYNGLAMQKYRATGDEYLPVIKIREMNNGISSDTEKAKVDIPKAAVIEDGDLLFSWSATLDVKIWSEGKGALNQHIFKVTSDTYPQSFYYFELMNYLSHFKMMADLRKTTMGHITLEHLKQANIVLPPIELIEKLDEKLKPIFEHILVLKKESNSLVKLRDWLLPMLMNGQVTVT